MHPRPPLGVLPAAAAIVLLCSSPLAASAQEEEYSREGFYIVASAVYADEQFRDSSGFQLDDAFGYSFAGGLRLNQYAAIEIEHEVPIEGFALDPQPGTGLDGDDIVTALLLFNAKFHMPLGRVEPFLQYGIGMMYANPSPQNNDALGSLNAKNDRVDFAFQFGGGFDVYVTPSWALTVDANYVLPTDRLLPLTHLSYSVGVKYRFGAFGDEDDE